MALAGAPVIGAPLKRMLGAYSSNVTTDTQLLKSMITCVSIESYHIGLQKLTWGETSSDCVVDD